MVEDRIEREIMIEALPERVWLLVAEPGFGPPMTTASGSPR